MVARSCGEGSYRSPVVMLGGLLLDHNKTDGCVKHFLSGSVVGGVVPLCYHTAPVTLDTVIG